MLKYLAIPEDYMDFIEYIEKHSDLILSDKELMPRILDELNKRLEDAKNGCDLHQDSRMMLATIRFYQDSFSKEYNHNLSIQKMIKLANDDLLNNYYELCKEHFMRAKFLDTLNFNYQVKETTQRVANRKRRENILEDAALIKTPRVLLDVEEKCQESEAIVNIKKYIEERGKIEYFELILDRKSYSQTIYNVFNLSLALRNKAVSLVEEDGKIQVTYFNESKEEIEYNVVEITYEMYKKLCETNC